MVSHGQGVFTDSSADEVATTTPGIQVLRWQGIIIDSIRTALRSQRARRVCDEDDLRQGVSLALLLAAQHGELSAASPQQARAFIWRITINQVNATLRRAFAVRRDFRRTLQLDRSLACRVPDPGCDPATMIADAELQQLVLERLDLTGRGILEKRKLGLTWSQIAAEDPDRRSAEAIRKMFIRNLRPLVGRYLRASAG